MHQVTIATEDQLSEALLRRVILEFSPRLKISNSVGRRGNGHLRSKLANLVAASQAGMPVVMLTDSDGPRSLETVRSDWMGSLSFDSDRFYLAVAVQEAESWFLADEAAVEAVLGRRPRSIPVPTDDIMDPKEWLLNEARRSARRVREQMVREEQGRVRIGVGYNTMAARAVAEIWCPRRARANSPSLDRLMSDLLSW